MVYSYEDLESTLTHKKNIMWAYFPGENVSDWCVSIAADAYKLDSARALNTDHLAYIHRILDKYKDTNFQIW